MSEDRIYPGFEVNAARGHTMSVRIPQSKDDVTEGVARKIADTCEKIAEETPYNVGEIECIMSRLLEAMDWDTAITMYRKFGIRGLQTLRFKDHNR